MDLALLVYGISLLSGIKTFFIFAAVAAGVTLVVTGVYTGSWYFGGYEYSWDCNRDGTLKENVKNSRENFKNIFKKTIPIFALLAFIPIIIPSEKTAYTMVGAYAAQKVSENEKVQQLSGKVLTIIEQKLDSYVDEGIKNAENKVADTVNSSSKKDKK